LRTGGVFESVLAGVLAALLGAATGCSSFAPVEDKGTAAVEGTEGLQKGVPPAVPAAASNVEGTFVVTLFPARPTRRDPVKATLRDAVTHAEGNAFSWKWFVNGERAGSNDPVLPAGEAKRRDTVWAEASAFSGGKGIIVSSPRVVIVNSMPAVSDAAFDTLSPKKGDILKVSVKSVDPDGDPVRLTYKWVVNDRVVQEGEKSDYRLASEKKGDQVHCEVYPHDGHSPGTWSSTPIVEVRNSPPRLLSQPPPSAGPGGTFSYKVSAEDIDGDPVQIELLEGPEGMVLERDTVRWSPGPGFQGEGMVILRVTDGAGGEARQEFTLTAANR
jgi:hypothetical protein